MAVDFSGKWTLEKNENFDEFLKAMNVGMLKRTAASKATPTMEITQDGDNFNIVTKAVIRTMEVKFKMGEEFTTKDMEGKDMKMMATWDGSKQVVKNIGNPDGIMITRELENGKLVQTQTKGEVSCRRIFAKS